MPGRITRRRLGFRMVLGIVLAWSAWPTVAGALDGSGAHQPAPPTSSTTASAPTTVSTSTTVSTPPAPPSTATAPAPASDAAAAAPVTDAPAPPAVGPPAAEAPPAAAPTDPAVAAASLPNVCDAAAGDIVAAMNRDRAGNGVGPLCANAQLTGFAQAWAEHLAQTKTFVHQDLLTVISSTPFHVLAENLLVGSQRLTVDQMEGAWMASPGHREHIVDARYVTAGVGTARSDDGRIYVVVDFGGDVRA